MQKNTFHGIKFIHEIMVARRDSSVMALNNEHDLPLDAP